VLSEQGLGHHEMILPAIIGSCSWGHGCSAGSRSKSRFEAEPHREPHPAFFNLTASAIELKAVAQLFNSICMAMWMFWLSAAALLG
jgi:hypothetical protein